MAESKKKDRGRWFREMRSELKKVLDRAFDTYTSTPQNDIIENCEGKTWMQVCINDIEQFINDYKDKSDSSYNYDIAPSKVVENFTKIKTMLIQAGWEWNI